MNTNLIHNILNLLIALSAALSAFLVANGCTVNALGVMECSRSTILSPEVAAAVASALAFVKIAINILRDGFSGLTKPQPPVKRN